MKTNLGTSDSREKAPDESAEPPTRAIFRRDRTKPRGVFVIFPDVPATRDPWMVTCFDPQGGHGAGDPFHCIAQSVPADPFTEADAASVRRVLTDAYGYNLAILRRIPANALDKRRAALNR